MPHLFLPLAEAIGLKEYRLQLTAAHDAVARAAAAHQVAVASIDHWGCLAKRRAVDLSALAEDPELRGLIGVASQPFAEIVNQLATVERLLDTLAWADQIEAVEVTECNPSTSRGPAAPCSHDLVVRCPDRLVVVEVSDVAGDSGNANRKMEKDLDTLDRCTCDGPVRRILAVSRQSARWLQARPGLVTVVEAGEGEGTWIVERTPAGPASGHRDPSVVESGVDHARSVLMESDAPVAAELLEVSPEAIEPFARSGYSPDLG